MKNNPRTIADVHNPGKYHPESIMSCCYIRLGIAGCDVYDKDGRLKLAPDDEEGMQALYEQVKAKGVYNE